MLTCAKWLELSASETKYSVGCGFAVAGEAHVTAVTAEAAMLEKQKTTAQMIVAGCRFTGRL
jgi:hypothetical protein